MKVYYFFIIGMILMMLGTYTDIKNNTISFGFLSFLGVYFIGVFAGFVISKL